MTTEELNHYNSMVDAYKLEAADEYHHDCADLDTEALEEISTIERDEVSSTQAMIRIRRVLERRLG